MQSRLFSLHHHLCCNISDRTLIISFLLGLLDDCRLASTVSPQLIGKKLFIPLEVKKEDPELQGIGACQVFIPLPDHVEPHHLQIHVELTSLEGQISTHTTVVHAIDQTFDWLASDILYGKTYLETKPGGSGELSILVPLLTPQYNELKESALLAALPGEFGETFLQDYTGLLASHIVQTLNELEPPSATDTQAHLQFFGLLRMQAKLAMG